MKRYSLFFLATIWYHTNAQFINTCITPNRETATCISIYDCPLLLNAVRTTNPKQIQFLQESRCDYTNADSNPPFVCCGSADFYRPLSKQPPRTTKGVLPDRSSCGYQDEDRILGGTATGLSEFPWMALLQYRKNDGRGLTFGCGGSLLSKRYVLTAAHCVTGKIESVIGKLHRVRLGEWNTETEVDCATTRSLRDCNDPPVDVSAEQLIPHPQYTERNYNKMHDIALIRLSRDVRFTDFIRPICLPSAQDRRPEVGEKLVVSGWGRTEYANSSPTKLKVRVPVVSDYQCMEKFQTLRMRLELAKSQLCAGGEFGRDSCNGDSGGPLMSTFSDDAGQWYVEGVVSIGASCGQKGWPGIYTRVRDYLQWIQQTVRP